MNSGSDQEMCFMSARQLAALIRERKLSSHEVMSAFLRQISGINPKINAIVAKLDDEQCLALADDADQRLARGEEVGPLHGLPFAFKDLDPAVGFPMTRGSLIFKDFMPTEDSVLVERLRRAGVIAIGKTNVSEFGMGSHTYNEVYGTTGNQPTISNVVPLEKVAKAAGYVNVERVREREDLVYEFKDMLKKDGPSMLLVKVNEMVEDAGRVMLDPPDITKRFMQAIQ